MARARRKTFDVFLSHSSKDKPTVRAVAERLRDAGLKVWFDEWVIKPGDPILEKVSEGLEICRRLVLFMSRNGFGSDWVTVEHQSILFADPKNKARRFIPVLLDDAEIPAFLKQFAYIDWRSPDEKAFKKLLASCQPVGFAVPVASAKQPNAVKPSGHPPSGGPGSRTHSGRVLQGHEERVQGVSVSGDGRIAVSGSNDWTVRVWDLGTETCSAVLEGHAYSVRGVSVSGDGRIAVSGSDDQTARVWDLRSGTCSAVLKGYGAEVLAVSVSGDGQIAVLGSSDRTVRVCDLGSGTCAAVLEGHTARVWCVSMSGDGRIAVSGSDDRTVRVWDLGAGTCSAVLEGHTARVNGVSVSGDGRIAASGSDDGTVRVWDLGTRTCSAVLEGHTHFVNGVSVSGDGRIAVSGSDDGTVRAWDLGTGTCSAVLEGHTDIVWGVSVSGDGRVAVSGSADRTVRVWDLSAIDVFGSPPEGQSFYTNAKVLLTGESGAGKTGLAQRLIDNKFESTYSTDGVWATQLKLTEDGPMPEGVEREIWLWDFAGQADYRLIHQLYMDGTDLALLVFDPQKENPFDGLARWDSDITRAAGGRPFLKRLVAARCDRGGLRIGSEQVEAFMQRHGFDDYHETSALHGHGCDDLRKKIIESIPWDRLPRTSSPVIFRRIKEEVLKLKDEGRVLLRRAELKQVLEMRMIGEAFTPEILQTVVGLLANAGVVWPLDFGGYVLLQPERINSYAGAVVRAVRAHSEEIGCIAEADVLAGNFPVPQESKLDPDDEPVVLRAMVETLLKRGLCLKEPTNAGPMLVFPAYFKLDRPEQTEHPPPAVRYRFVGSLEEVYTTLVVRLHHTDSFDKDKLWRDAADFLTKATKLRVGLKLDRGKESDGVLTAYLDPKLPIEVKATFMKFVHDHLLDERARRASGVKRERLYVCDRCSTSFDPATVEKTIAAGKKDIYCQVCDDGHRVLLLDEIETLFQAPKIAERAKEWNQQAQAVLDSQSLEQILLGHVQAIAGEAGQIWRAVNFGDWGIDGEIEFKDYQGKASGRRVYLQLKSGNSYLETRKKDGVEVFRIKEARHADYWQSQPCPVWLVIRTTDERSGSSIRWMEISEYLRRKSQGGTKPVKQIEFQGQPLTAQTLMALRDKTVDPRPEVIAT